MTDAELQAIRERADKATPGDWIAELQASGGTYPAADLDFIAHAREDVPNLLDEIEALRKELINATHRARANELWSAWGREGEAVCDD